MPLSLLSDAVTNKGKEEIVEKSKNVEDSSSFSSPQGTGFGRPNFSTLNKDVIGLKFLYFVAYISSYHENAIHRARLGVQAICLLHQKGEIPLNAFLNGTTSQLAGFFSILSL